MDNNTSPENTPTSSTTEPCKTCGKLDKFCNGTGFYDVDVPVGHPDFSKVFRCPNNPLEQDDQRKQVLRKLSNLGAFEGATFANFNLSMRGMSEMAYHSLRGAHNAAMHFAQDPQGKWLVLEGNYGSGKTHLAAAIGNERLEQHGELVLFITAPDLLDHLRGAYSKDAEMGYNELFDRVRQADLLILDDLGVENPSEWSREKMFQLLNHRYTERLPTVITTNVNIDMLDPRLRSRMLDMSVVQNIHITAPDYRSIHTNAQERLSDLHLYQDYTFDTFDVTTNIAAKEVQNIQRSLQVSAEYAQSGDGWLVLIGHSGTGKTHLAAAIANYWAHQGGEVMFVSAPDLLGYLRRTFSPESSVSFDAQFERVKEIPFLVLDDLSSVDQSKAWVREKMVQIIKHRYLRRLPTVITTTHMIDELDGQIRTRVMDKRISQVFAITIRPYVDRMRSRM